MSPARRWLILVLGALVLVTVALGVRSAVVSIKLRANPWNTGDLMTMLRVFKAEHGQYPKSLVELEPYNFTTNNPGGTRSRAQNLKTNVWGQPYIYESNGMSYVLVSPGRHGYQRARVVPWRPEYDGAHHPDTSLVIANGKAEELALARGQGTP